MKTTTKIRYGLGAAILMVGLATRVPAQENKDKAPPNVRTVEQLVSVTAKVEAIDLAKRELTLKGPLGNSETVVVSEKVKRLNEIKPGDEVTATYYIGMAAELREPTEEEKKAPFVVLGGKGRASSDQEPAAGGLRVIRVVATIEGLDRPTQTVTLKGPMGHYHTVRVKDPSILEKPRLGDTVVVTCAEGLAVSVEKSPVKSKE